MGSRNAAAVMGFIGLVAAISHWAVSYSDVQGGVDVGAVVVLFGLGLVCSVVLWLVRSTPILAGWLCWPYCVATLPLLGVGAVDSIIVILFYVCSLVLGPVIIMLIKVALAQVNKSKVTALHDSSTPGA